MHTDQYVKPDWRYVALDETRHWATEIATACKRLFGIYVFDANTHVHCCELTPSYELYFVRNEALSMPDDDEQREAIYDALITNPSEVVSYTHTRNINAEKCKKVGFEIEPDDRRDAREMANDVISYVCEACDEVPYPD